MDKKRATIAIDMDGVIADTVLNFIQWYERDYGVRVGLEAFEGKPEAEGLPGNAVRKYVLAPGFFRSVPVMEGAKEAVLELSKTFDVYIVSAAMEFPQSLIEKYDWLQEHFPFISWRNIIFCGDKSIIGTNYMIDDHVRNLDTFKGTALMFTAGHNAGVNHHTRVNNWKEVVSFLKAEALHNHP
ncbi:5'(3')-deoxyribonucleotidase [Segetibacter sp.]|jgi:5'-nucleotidase|uniref:5' nucleotidase, NT5C type n=1 Tax=Segetibacter sp. TaxID=2231182 RepID=UPI002621BA05|nr:5'(3')-deoxyribonucleotidase [Segetibacter sp.]MCW3081277.1 5(3)-deoxyribonucleotidase [Segetibacter sp.]